MFNSWRRRNKKGGVMVKKKREKRKKREKILTLSRCVEKHFTITYTDIKEGFKTYWNNGI